MVPSFGWSGNSLVPLGRPLTPRPIGSVSPYPLLLTDVAASLGIDLAGVYGFSGGPARPTALSTGAQVWSDPRSDGHRWIEPLRDAITDEDSPAFGARYRVRPVDCIGGVDVTVLVPDVSGPTIWLFAIGPWSFLVGSLSAEHGRTTVEGLIAAVEVVGTCGSPNASGGNGQPR
jgi:hypothetical protein